MTLDEPRWGAPQVPGDDPRSPEWRDPNAQPWWGGGQPPPGAQSPGQPPQGPRRARLIAALGAAVVLIIVLGVVLAANRSTRRVSPDAAIVPAPVESLLPAPGILPSALPQDSAAPLDSAAPTDDTDPVSVTEAYYGDLAVNRSTAAWNLLCAARQQAMPLSAYTAAYSDDVATGTGIKTFTQDGQQQEQGDQAAVPGTLVLADQESVPITVVLQKEGGGWRVCGSDLGGVLPNPGTGASADPGTGGVTT